MARSLGVVCILAWLLAPPASLGGEADSARAEAEAPGIRVEPMVFCAAIKDREPAGVADTFPSDAYGIYCFTRVVGAPGSTSVSHVWYRGEALVASRSLAVRASPWRTWSLIELKEPWKGDWRVDVLSAEGEVVASRKFATR